MDTSYLENPDLLLSITIGHTAQMIDPSLNWTSRCLGTLPPQPVSFLTQASSPILD